MLVMIDMEFAVKTSSVPWIYIPFNAKNIIAAWTSIVTTV
jgi:hypothetical protein